MFVPMASGHNNLSEVTHKNGTRPARHVHKHAALTRVRRDVAISAVLSTPECSEVVHTVSGDNEYNLQILALI